MDQSNKYENCVSLINTSLTPYVQNQIPFKKFSYKKYLYNKRINYGHMCKSGIVNENLRLLPIIEISNSISQLIKPDSNKSIEKKNIIDETFFKKLMYDSDLNFYMRESKREVKLKKMLRDRLNKLIKK